MKSLLNSIAIFALLFCLSNQGFSQGLRGLKDQYNSKNCDTLRKRGYQGKQIDILAPEAFDRYLEQQYSYTILGSLTPSSGLKFETTNPSVSLKGNIWQSKNHVYILSPEITAGANNGLGEILSENKLNVFFKLSTGLNILLNRNWADVGENNQSFICLIRAKAIDKYDALIGTRDTMLVLNAIADPSATDGAPLSWKGIETLYFNKEKERRETSLSETEQSEKSDAIKKIAASYFKKFADMPADMSSEASLDAALKIYAISWKDPAKDLEEKEKLMKQIKKFSALKGTFIDSLHNFELSQVKDTWTMKYLTWLNILPEISNTTFSLFDAGSQTINPGHSFLYGIQFSKNDFWKYKEAYKYIYWSFGFGFQKVNTLDEMTKYTYKQSTTLKVADPSKPTDSQTLTKEESGTGYQGDFKEGFGYDIFSSLYFSPSPEPYVPGIYAEGKFSHGNAWINKDKVSLTLGPIWNVTSSEKDAKNLLTIVPYVQWSNLLKQYKDATLSNIIPTHDLFSIGIKVGIPVNIGK